MASTLGVSVAPVREAFQRLEQEGFLQSRPRVGTVVKKINPEDVRGRLMIREALESQAARLYCGAPVRRHRRKLERLARLVDGQHPSTAAQWQAEVDFHRALVALTECEALIQAFDNVMRQSLFFVVNRVFPALAPGQDMDSFHRNHLLLIDALTTDDSNAAAQIAYDHAHLRLARATADPASAFYRPKSEPSDTRPRRMR
jgi:DNA-binding GntR family transcriptional regulator